MTRGRTSPARRVATRVLYRVAEKGAYATAALDAELGRERSGDQLGERDAALATEIVYGALRVLPALDRALDAHLKRPAIEPLLRAAMRVAAYQILHLGRVPVSAAVDEAVGLVRAERGPRLAGVANAVLRRLERPETAEPPTRLVVAEWIESELVRSLGAERAALFLDAREMPPPLGLRVVHGAREALIEQWQTAHPRAWLRASAVAPRAVAVRGAGDPRRLKGYAEGHVAVQEIGSQLVAAALGAAEGERIADLCAGHGSKTACILQSVGPRGRVVALDLYEEKLERARAEALRLGLDGARLETHAVDLSVGAGGIEGGFDRVLVDAPCTGLGTIHRRPERLLRIEAADLERMAALQLALVRNAVELVRPGGLLEYAVCSPAHVEGAGVARVLESERPELVRLHEPAGGLAPDPDGILRIGPWTDPAAAPDAYQVVRWRRDA